MASLWSGLCDRCLRARWALWPATWFHSYHRGPPSLLHRAFQTSRGLHRLRRTRLLLTSRRTAGLGLVTGTITGIPMLNTTFISRHGVFWAHMGWLTDRKTYDVAFRPIKDLDRFPELVWLIDTISSPPRV